MSALIAITLFFGTAPLAPAEYDMPTCLHLPAVSEQLLGIHDEIEPLVMDPPRRGFDSELLWVDVPQPDPLWNASDPALPLLLRRLMPAALGQPMP